MKSYDAYIFDFDYTLADATGPIVESFHYAFDKLNIKRATYEDIVNTVGIPLRDAYTILTGDSSDDGKEVFFGHYKLKSDEITVEQTTFIEGARELLENLKLNNKKVGIVSSRWGKRIDTILVNLEARHLVDFIIGTEHVDNYKPDPEGLFKMIEMMECKEPLYIGDSYIDAETAKNAEVDFVGVTTGTTPREKLESYPNVMILDSLKELW